MPEGHDGGYLWRMNTYWRFEERDGGVYVQCESISLTRDIPRGLGWLIEPFVTSIPRESLQDTLGNTRLAVLQRRSSNVREPVAPRPRFACAPTFVNLTAEFQLCISLPRCPMLPPFSPRCSRCRQTPEQIQPGCMQARGKKRRKQLSS